MSRRLSFLYSRAMCRRPSLPAAADDAAVCTGTELPEGAPTPDGASAATRNSYHELGWRPPTRHAHSAEPVECTCSPKPLTPPACTYTR